MRKIVFGAALLVLTSCSSKQPEQITLLDGTPVELSEFTEGVPAIVNFWASSCSFCKDELPYFEKISRDYPEIAVIGINLQESPTAAAKYWRQGGYTFPSLLDPSSQLKAQFDVITQPTTIFIDMNGDHISKKNGPMQWKEIERRTKELLSEEKKIVEEPQEIDLLPAVNHELPITSAVPSLLSQWYYRTVDHLIPLDQILSGGPAKDGIPSIDNPQFLLSREVDFLDDDDIGILVEHGGHIKFYPYAILNWHEIVNDRIGGDDVTVTYCPLCATGVVYSSLITEGVTEFGVSGFLYQPNLLMYDRATDSLWNQVTGQAVVGPLTGEKLTFIKSDIVRYAAAKNASIDLLVLSADTGFNRDYSRTPYDGYEDEDRTIFPTNAAGDTRLHPKDLVYGVTIDGKALAISEDFIHNNGVFQGYLGEGVKKIPLQIAFDSRTERLVITRYYKEEPGRKEELVPVPAFWFSWLSQYPDTKLMK